MIKTEIADMTTDRDRALWERAIRILKGNVMSQTAQLFHGHTMICPSIGHLQGIWNWDSAFHAVGASYFDVSLAYDSVEGFLSLIREDGMLPDVMRFNGFVGWYSTKPPVFPWAVWRIYEKTGDPAFLERVYDKLCANERFWRTQRFDGKGFFYSHSLPGSEEEERKYAGWETGWDNSPRWDKGVEQLYCVDLNAYMVLFYRAMTDIARTLGRPYEVWEQRRRQAEDFCETVLWNQTAQCYADRDRFDGHFSSCLTPASFVPLFASTASPGHAGKMAKLVTDPRKFGGYMPTVTLDDPAYSDQYWRGPMWLNMAYFAAKGLKNYGCQEGELLRENILQLVYDDTSIHENYDCRKKIGLYAPDFSWSAVFVMLLLADW